MAPLTLNFQQRTMNKLKLLLKKLSQLVNGLESRERLICAVLALIIIYVIWHFALYSPLMTSKQKYSQQIVTIKSTIKSVTDETNKIIEAVKAFDQDKVEKHQKLQDELAQLQEQFKFFNLTSRSPNQLSPLLQEVLAKTKGLKLTSIENLSSPVTKEEKGKTINVFNYSLLLQFQGNYFDTISFLQELEKLDWQLYWGSIDYTVDNYPKAKITLKLHTLTTKEA